MASSRPINAVLGAQRGMWRRRAYEVAHAVLDAIPQASVQEKKRALHAAYPFGHRSQWPYKVWLSVRAEALAGWPRRPLRHQKTDPRQISMDFSGGIDGEEK